MEVKCPECGQVRLMYPSTYNLCKTTLCIHCFNKNHNPTHTPDYRKKRTEIVGASRYYVRLLNRQHPRADKSGRVKRAVIVMEAKLGRFLLPDEEVHHINGIITDDRIENLELTTHRDHVRKHHQLRRGAKLAVQ